MNWPCRVAINMEELFGSEGKAQVYGHLHDLLNKENMSSTGNTWVTVFFIVFTVNEHKNICIAGLNSQAGYATGHTYA